MSYGHQQISDLEDYVIAYEQAQSNQERKEVISALREVYGYDAGLLLARARHQAALKQQIGIGTVPRDYGAPEQVTQEQVNGGFAGINSGNYD